MKPKLTTRLQQLALRVFNNHPQVIRTIYPVVAAAKSWLQYGDRLFPQIIHIEISQHCSRSCWYCPNHKAPMEDRLMSLETFDEILGKLVEIKWSGQVSYHILNEPTLHPFLSEMVRRTTRRLPKAKPVLFTNGDRLTRELAASLVRCGLFRAIITRHAPYRTGWDLRILGICSEFPNVYHIHRIGWQHLINVGDTNPVQLRKFPVCKTMTRVLPIRVDGTVAACCCDYNRSTMVGDVLKDGVLGVVNSAYYRDVRARLMRGENVFKICNGCSKIE